MIAANNKPLSVIPQNRSLQRGASLVEGIAYLGIAAVVILGAVSLLTGAFGSAQSNRTAEELTSIRTAVRKVHLGQSNYGAVGNITAAMAQAGVFPAALPNNGGAITNAWGGAVVVGSIAGSQFTVSYAAVPEAVCVNILTTASGWVSAAVNGAAALPNAAAISAAQATGAAGCTAGANAVVFTSL